jgi:hypothetical protein
MESKKIGLIAVILLLGVAVVDGATITFIDSAYIGNGTLKVVYPNNTPVISLNSSEMAELGNVSAYMLKYDSGSFLKAESEQGFELPTLNFLLIYFTDPVHWVNLLVLILCLIIFWAGLTGQL